MAVCACGPQEVADVLSDAWAWCCRCSHEFWVPHQGQITDEPRDGSQSPAAAPCLKERSRAVKSLNDWYPEKDAGGTLVLACCGGAWSAGVPHRILCTCSAGFGVATNIVYMSTGAAMAAGLLNVLTKVSDEPGYRLVCRRSAIVLGLSSIFNLVLWSSGGVAAPFLAHHIANPLVFAHMVEELLVTPLLVLNVGQLAGFPAKEMAPPAFFASLGMLSLTAASAVFDTSKIVLLLGTGVMLLTKVGRRLISDLPPRALAVSAMNHVRSEAVTDLLVFSWIGYPVTLALGLSSLSMPSHMMAWLAVLDLTSQLGVCHMLSNSPATLKSSEEYIDMQLALAGPGAVRVAG